MEEKPILFNTEMVKAILDGRKTQSRRPVKIQPKQHHWDIFDSYRLKILNLKFGNFRFHHSFSEGKVSNGEFDSPVFRCPFGKIGDRLYVRETWADLTNEGLGDIPVAYKASTDSEGDRIRIEYGIQWKPSIHMPKKYARIWLEITDIRVERIRDITEDEALKEGIISNQDYEDNAGSEDLFPCPMCNGMQVHGCLGENMGVSETDCLICDSQKNRFGILWDYLYDNWYVNPWVWVIEFKRIEK